MFFILFCVTKQKIVNLYKIEHNIMSEQMLELIKTRTIFLKEGQTSGEVVLVDEVGGNMYFTFC